MNDVQKQVEQKLIDARDELVKSPLKNRPMESVGYAIGCIGEALLAIKKIAQTDARGDVEALKTEAKAFMHKWIKAGIKDEPYRVEMLIDHLAPRLAAVPEGWNPAKVAEALIDRQWNDEHQRHSEYGYRQGVLDTLDYLRPPIQAAQESGQDE